VIDTNGDGIIGDAGDHIKYSFIVTNTGTATLTNVIVTDSKVIVIGGPITLAAGAVDKTTFTAVYTITSDDVKIGSVNNQAKVEGTHPNGNKVSDLSDGSNNTGDNPTVTPLAGGVIALIKTAVVVDANGDGIKGNAGDKINYSFTVANLGSVTLTNVTLTDPKVTVAGGPITLDVGAVDKTTFTAIYTITSADLNTGSVSNQAKAEGTDTIGNKVSDLSDNNSYTENDPTVTPLAGGVIALIKTAIVVDANGDGIKGNAGDKINYSFAVANVGSVSLTNVTVTDPKVTVAGGPITLAIGAIDKTTFTAIYTITSADLDTGSVSNRAKAEGTDTIGNKVSDLSDNNSFTENDPTVTDVNDVPIAVDDVIKVSLDEILNGQVDGNDKLSGDGGNIWTLVKQPTNGTLIFNQDGSFTFIPLANFAGEDSFTYKLCDKNGDCSVAKVTIMVEDILPNQIFTPNGDGQNDTYYVKNIEFYPGSRITIFNRWGNKVYEKSGYLNDWDGYSNVNKFGSNALPVGTYYYVIDYGVNRHKTGYVYLER
jgi:gliding motility-associated-like protein